MGYLINPIWSLETLVHAKAHYGRIGHYEVPTCGPWFIIFLHDFLNDLLYYKARGCIGFYAG